MYLTASRPDIAFVTFVCARYQDSGFELIAYSDVNHARCNDDCIGRRKSKIVHQCQFRKLMETPKNLFVSPINIQTVKAFMNRVGYQAVINRTNVDYAALLWWDFMNNVFSKKEAIQYPRFIKLIIADLIKKFPNIPQMINEDYHSIKDDIPLVSVYTIGNIRVRGMLISDEFLTEEICATIDFKEYETVFMNVDVLINQPNRLFIPKERIEKVDETKDAKMGSLETKTEEMQTPIPTLPRYLRTIISSGKNIT
nr:hypothetical protein [Tanacetum cinerariifolium]